MGSDGILSPGDVFEVIVLVPVVLQVVLFEVREQLDPKVGAPGRTVANINREMRPGGELSVGVVEVVGRQGDLS